MSISRNTNCYSQLSLLYSQRHTFIIIIIIIIIIYVFIYYADKQQKAPEHKRHTAHIQYTKKKAIHRNKTIKSIKHNIYI